MCRPRCADRGASAPGRIRTCDTRFRNSIRLSRLTCGNVESALLTWGFASWLLPVVSRLLRSSRGLFADLFDDRSLPEFELGSEAVAASRRAGARGMRATYERHQSLESLVTQGANPGAAPSDEVPAEQCLSCWRRVLLLSSFHEASLSHRPCPAPYSEGPKQQVETHRTWVSCH